MITTESLALQGGEEISQLSIKAFLSH